MCVRVYCPIVDSFSKRSRSPKKRRNKGHEMIEKTGRSALEKLDTEEQG